MKLNKNELEPVLEVGGSTLRRASWGGFSAMINSYAAGADFTPLLKGLEGDMCQCPHWGYVLKGALHLRYSDGREEVFSAGDIWYSPPGHTGWVEEDTDVVEFSPENEFAEVFGHIKSQVG